MLAASLAILGCERDGEQDAKKPLLKVSLATTPVIYTGLIAVADEKGFFKDAGLEVSIRSDYPAGLASLQALERGEVQMATGAAFAFASIMEDEPALRVLASVGSTSDHEIVARRDKGVHQPADLEGRRVGVVMDTVSEYALSMFLQVNSIGLDALTPVNISPPEIVEALVRGDVDAISMWGKFSYQARKRLGADAVAWPSQYALDYQWVLAAKDDLLARSPDVAKRFLRALKQAERFVLGHQADAKAIIATRWNLDPEFVEQVWDLNKLRVTLDQSLVISLESAVRWRISHKGMAESVTNILSRIHQAPLAEIDPVSVTLSR
jgi:NitT/TauT family transport system substrate-binding protein